MTRSIPLYLFLAYYWLQIHCCQRMTILAQWPLPRNSPRFYWTIYILHFLFFLAVLLIVLPNDPAWPYPLLRLATAIGSAGSWTSFLITDYTLRRGRAKARQLAT